MATLAENLGMWGGRYAWPQDGDEWGNQAAFSRQDYGLWKDSVVEWLIYPYLRGDSTVLELAPGHGRWSGYIAERVKRVFLVDISKSCINYCKQRLSQYANISYHVNDGLTLPQIGDGSVDFIWSYDSFVHMDEDAVDSYFREFARVLKIGAKAVIHHPGRRNFMLHLKSMRRWGRVSNDLYNLLSLGRVNDGWRSELSKELIRELAEKNGLRVEAQFNSWGDKLQYNNKLFHDYVSVLCRPG